MGTVEPLIEQNKLITTTQPNVEATLTCAYYQQVGHECKNYPFVNDKLNKLTR
jgi:hypothetical protein